MCNQAGCGACVVTAEMKDPNGVDGWKTKSVNTVSWFEQFSFSHKKNDHQILLLIRYVKDIVYYKGVE